MATSLSNVNLSCKIAAALTDTIQTFAVAGQAEIAKSDVIANGTSASQSDRFIIDKARTISAASSEDLDLFDLAGFDATTDLIGNTTTFAEITGLVIVNVSTTAGVLEVGGKGTSVAWTSILKDNSDIIQLPPSAWVAFANSVQNPAWDVTDVTNHILQMAAVTADVTYDIAILGRSA